jgi:hypothetical protein
VGRSVVLGAVLALAVAFAFVVWRLLRVEPLVETPPHAAAPPSAEPPPVAPEFATERQPIPVPVATPSAPTPARGESSADRHPEWKPVALSVLDRATRTDLVDVEIAVEPAEAHAHRPIDDSFVRQNSLRGHSPLTVPPKLAGLASSGFLVRAAGHAAALVDLDFEAGGAREVLLEPSCELRLRIDAPPANENLTVQLRRIEDVLAWFDWRVRFLSECERIDGCGDSDHVLVLKAKADFLRRQRDRIEADPTLLARFVVDAPARWSRPAPRAEWIVFDHLPPGEWLAVVVAEAALDAPRGAAGAKLEAGCAAERTLELTDRERPGAKPVHGIVDLAPGWSDDEAAAIPNRIELRRFARLVGLPRETSERTITRFDRDGASLRFAWDAGELAGGAWTARLPQYGVVVRFHVDVSDATPQEIRLAVGPPCDVVLTPIDAATRAPVASSFLKFASGEARAGDAIASAKARDGVYRFHAPLGRLFVQLEVPDPVVGFPVPLFAAFELAPGVNALTFETHPRAWLRIVLKDGDAVVPCLSEECHLEAKRSDGAGGVIGCSFHGGRDVRWILSSPGRYSVRVVDPPGFLDSDPVDVELPPGVLTDLTIPLKRTR